MFRESMQMLMCLSVLVSTCVSLHMVRDAYHRPINDQLSSLNDDAIDIIDSRNVVNDWLDNGGMATIKTNKNQQKQIDDNGSKTSYKALNLDFERLIKPQSSKSLSSSSISSTGHRYTATGIPIMFLKNQKRKMQLATNRLDDSQTNPSNENGLRFPSSSSSSSSKSSKSTFAAAAAAADSSILPMSVSFRNGLSPRTSATDDRFQWQKQVKKKNTEQISNVSGNKYLKKKKTKIHSNSYRNYN